MAKRTITITLPDGITPADYYDVANTIWLVAHTSHHDATVQLDKYASPHEANARWTSYADVVEWELF